LGYVPQLLVLRPSLTIYVDSVDELIISEIRKNNQKVIRDLYVKHYPMILNFVVVNSGTADEAKDVYQETFIAFYQRLQDDQFSLTCRIATYLYAISKRLWLKRLAAKKMISIRIDEIEEFLGVEEELMNIDTERAQMDGMKRSFESLGEPCSTLLRDFYLFDMSMEKITEKFGYTNPANAKNQKYKCLQRLKKIFFEIYPKRA
jgi:RNA polymerase sigma factor (sigma-70 family)